jgi:integrative and conjugative element protein (TIGR02256 family)
VRFARANGGHFEIGADVARILLDHRQMDHADHESGGLLLGRLIDTTNDVVVDEITTPSAADRRERYRFFRDISPAQQKVNAAWSESSGTCIYLGEWHSHPEDIPNPSFEDRREWKRIVRLSEYEQYSLFFVIVGRVQTCAWELGKHGRCIEALQTAGDQ